MGSPTALPPMFFPTPVTRPPLGLAVRGKFHTGLGTPQVPGFEVVFNHTDENENANVDLFWVPTLSLRLWIQNAMSDSRVIMGERPSRPRPLVKSPFQEGPSQHSKC